MRIDAVLPLTAADCGRARILFRTLEAFFEPLGTCFVVAPDRDVSAVRASVSQRYVVMRDTDVVPELRLFRRHGWFVQQLVKLAASERVETPFYLTLDADVVCVRPTRYEDLVIDGRALVQTTPPHHPEWNDDAERVLSLPRLGRQYGVTPAVLSRGAVGALARHVARRVRPRLRRLVSWRSYLLRNLPWTEYALYYTFLERTGSFDAYHVHGGREALYSNCVWMEDDFADWDPADASAPFSVVQSATRIAPENVWARVRSLTKRATAASSDASGQPRSLPSAL